MSLSPSADHSEFPTTLKSKETNCHFVWCHRTPPPPHTHTFWRRKMCGLVVLGLKALAPVTGHLIRAPGCEYCCNNLYFNFSPAVWLTTTQMGSRGVGNQNWGVRWKTNEQEQSCSERTKLQGWAGFSDFLISFSILWGVTMSWGIMERKLGAGGELRKELCYQNVWFTLDLLQWMDFSLRWPCNISSNCTFFRI